MTAPQVLTEDLGGSALSRAARRGELSRWYGEQPSSPDAWRARAQTVAREFAERDWLAGLADAFDARGAAAERLRRCSQQQGIVVTTGQQPGLFGGPLMTLAKALTAVALADALERATGIPAAPVFWAATDDADFDEGNWARVAVAGGTSTMRLTERPAAGMPMSRAPLGHVEELLRAFAEACGPAVDPAVLDAIRASYRPDATIGGAYVQLLRATLEPLGIAVLDASHPQTRHAAAGLMRRALGQADTVAAALDRREREIREAGYTPQVQDVAGLSLVFAHERGLKRRLTIAEAPRAAQQQTGEELSPNVLLRPVVERAILPTVAYVGGPGEIAYFAQLGAVADALDVASPLVVPRWSVTILEPRIQRVLHRLDATMDEVRDPHALETRLARASLPSPVADALRALRQHIEEDSAALEVGDVDTLVPPASIQGARGAMLHRLGRLERRYAAAMKRKEEQLMRDVATARASLHPDGVRQERALSWSPFLVRYGAPLLDDMRGEAARYAESLIGDQRTVTTPALVSDALSSRA